MRIPKRYGEYRRDSCPFCSRQATTTNSQKIPVCTEHKNSILGEMKCACDSYLDRMHGKFGVFFKCMKCGPISMSKALDLNKVVDESLALKPKAEPKKEIQVRSDDARYF